MVKDNKNTEVEKDIVKVNKLNGEDSFTAASRELFEELGIKSNSSSLVKLLRLKRRNSFLDVWFIECGYPIESLVLQAEEVAEAKWVTLDELKKMIDL